MKSKNCVTEVNDYKPDQLYQPVDTLNQNLYIQHNVNSFKATSHASYTNNHLIQSFYSNMQIPLLRNEIPVDASQISTGTNTIDNNLLLCQEYEKMISAIECNYKSNATIVGSNISEDKFPNFSSMPSQNNSFEKIIPVTNCIVTKAKSNIVKKNKDKWLSTISKRKSNNLIVLPATKIKKTLEINTFTGKLTPIMHFEKRKIKLTAQVPLSLGDLIVLVSFFYKLEYIEQQLLIEKMKILEASKPNQAAYLRQYVRITCPTYNENNIHFTPIPPELVASETNLNLHNVKSIDDILEKDFCVSEDNIHEESTKIDANVAEVYNGCLSVNCNTSYEFDFGSEFL